MKKILLLIMWLAPCMYAVAQTMYIHQGSVATMVDAATAGDMNYTETTLTVKGVVFPLAEVDSIVFDNTSQQADSVVVKYAGSSAKVYVPIDVAKYLTVTADGAHVSVVSSQLDGQEVIYALSGEAADGSFYQEGSYKCTLYLNGVTLTSSKGAAINIQNGKRINVNVTDGTVNTLTDSQGGLQTACFRIKGHAEFRGAGQLDLNGRTSHAYKSNEYTILKNTFAGTINVKSSVNDGIHVSQYFEMNNGTINIGNTAGDGIQVDITTNPLDELNGQIFLNGGAATITLNGDNAGGIKADSLLTCKGGTYTIVMGGNNSDGVTAYNARILNSASSPTFLITQNGGYIDVNGDKKKSACFKTETDLYFLGGTIAAYANGQKSKGVKVGGNYYYTSKSVMNVTPEVTGSMYVVTE